MALSVTGGYVTATEPRNMSIGFPVNYGFFALNINININIDKAKGKAELVRLGLIHGEMSTNMKSQSGSGNAFQTLFSTSENILKTASTIVLEVDVRRAGGHVISLPSVHPSYMGILPRLN